MSYTACTLYAAVRTDEEVATRVTGATTSDHVSSRWVKESALKHYIQARAKRSAVMFVDAEHAGALGSRLFSISLLGACLVTFGIVKPDMSMNPVLKVVGYWNVCIAIDYDPSRYIVLYVFVFTQLTWTWSAWLFYARARGNEDVFGAPLVKWVKVSAIIFVLFSPFITFCFLIVPTPRTMNEHTMPFNIQMLALGQWCVTQWLCVLRSMPAQGSLPWFTFATWANAITACIKVHQHMSYMSRYEALVIKYGAETVDAMPADLVGSALSSRQLVDLLWLASVVIFTWTHPLTGYMPLSETLNPTAMLDLQEDANSSKEAGQLVLVGQVSRRASGRNTFDFDVDALDEGRLTHVHPPYIRAPAQDEASWPAIAERVARSFETDFRKTLCPVGGPRRPDADHGCTLGVCRATLSIDEDGLEALHPDLREGFFAKAQSYGGIARFSCTELGAARVALRVEVPDDMQLLQQAEGSSSEASASAPQALVDEEARSLLDALRRPALDAPGGRFADFLFAENMKDFWGVSAEAVAAHLDIRNEANFIARTCKRLYWLNATLRARTLRNLYKQELYPGGLAPKTGIFGKEYFAGLPFRLGPGYCKWGLVPRQKHQCTVKGRSLAAVEAKARRDARDAAHVPESRARYVPDAEKFLQSRDAVFDFVVQVATNEEHRADLGDCVWPEDLSPYVPVGTLTIHKGQGLSDLLKGEADRDGDHLGFNPWNQLAAHRPVGVDNYARKVVYDLRQRLRAGRDGVTAMTTCPFLAAGGKTRDAAAGQHVHTHHAQKMMLKSHVQAQVKRAARQFSSAEDAFRKGHLVFALVVLVCLALQAYRGLGNLDGRQWKIVESYGYYHVSVLFHRDYSYLLAEYGWIFVLYCWLWSAWLFFARVRGTVVIFGQRTLLLVQASASVFAALAPSMVLNLLTGHVHEHSFEFVKIVVLSFDTITLALMQYFLVQWYVASRCMPSGYNFVSFSLSVGAFVLLSVVKLADHVGAHSHSPGGTRELAAGLRDAGAAREWSAWRQAVDVVWYLSIFLIDQTHVMREFAPLAEGRLESQDLVLMNAAGQEEVVHLQVDDVDKEAGDALESGLIDEEWVPYVKCPEEDEAANAELGKAVADSFEKAFHALGCPVGGADSDHGWSLGVLRATFEVHEDGICALHPHLREGFLKAPRRYEAIVRVHCTDVCVARMSVRVELPDDMVVIKDELGDADGVTHGRHADFMMAENLKEFWGIHAKVIKAFLDVTTEQSVCKKVLAALPWLFQLVRLVVLRGLYTRLVYKNGGQAPQTGLWGKEYYGGLPFRLGPGVCKWGLLPRQRHPCTVPGKPLHQADDMSIPELERAQMHREDSKTRYVDEAQRYLDEQDVVFDFAIQVATDEEHDVASPEAPWNEDLSAYLPVGHLTIHRGQHLMGLLADHADKEGDHLRFNVWNQLAAHRPVGPTNWARKYVYARRQQLRAERDGVAEPTRCPFGLGGKGTASESGCGHAGA